MLGLLPSLLPSTCAGRQVAPQLPVTGFLAASFGAADGVSHQEEKIQGQSNLLWQFPCL